MDSNIPWIKIGKTLKHKKIQMFMNNLGCIVSDMILQHHSTEKGNFYVPAQRQTVSL